MAAQQVPNEAAKLLEVHTQNWNITLPYSVGQSKTQDKPRL
jgi:hypothetical protein